jgi:hypothetical protein
VSRLGVIQNSPGTREKVSAAVVTKKNSADVTQLMPQGSARIISGGSLRTRLIGQSTLRGETGQKLVDGLGSRKRKKRGFWQNREVSARSAGDSPRHGADGCISIMTTKPGACADSSAIDATRGLVFSGILSRALSGHAPTCACRQLRVDYDGVAAVVIESGAHNWALVPNARERYFNAAMRHLNAYFYKGETRDAESGLHTLAHAACCVVFLLALDLRGAFKKKRR